mmetsp:Transcript_6978/g.15921  ORF Transcript_6978/g.15921 Transcript_6978/m.15921 type:complete len:253 (+) Transcript_6978:2089-2847(+)
MQHHGTIQSHATRVGHDFIQHQDTIRHHRRVRVTQHIVQDIVECSLIKFLLVQMIHFQNAHHTRLPHVGVAILQRSAQRFTSVFNHLGQPQRTQCSKCQTPHHRIFVPAIFNQCVCTHLSQIWVGLSVVTKEEVHHLLNHQIPRLNRQHHLREQPRYVNSQCHVSYHLLHNVTLALFVLFGGKGAQQLTELVDFSLFGFGEVGIIAAGTTAAWCPSWPGCSRRTSDCALGHGSRSSGGRHVSAGWVYRCHCR